MLPVPDDLSGIFKALHDQDIAGYIYVFALQSGPIPIGYDANNRPELTWNFRAMRTRT